MDPVVSKPTRLRRRVQPRSLSAKQQRVLDKAKQEAAKLDNRLFAEMYVFAVERQVYDGNDRFLKFLSSLDQIPVGIEEFLDSDEFMGATDLVLWPEVREAIIAINKYWWKGKEYGAYDEALLMGATSTGKTEIAKVTMCYHAHILGCMKNPQEFFGLPSATAIVFVIQAAKPHVTKRVIYLPCRAYIEQMPWFMESMRPHKLVEAELFFPEKNIRIVPGSSDADAILGEAIIGGALDEVNFMAVVQQSKRSNAGVTSGRGGTYDQARNLHTAITRRKKGRFMGSGPNIGLITCSSSTRYKGDFTDKRKEEVVTNGLRSVYIYDKVQYEARPWEGRYCGDTFRVVVLNEAATDIQIFERGEKVPRGSSPIEIPIEHLEEFRLDAPGALRDVCGISVNSINPFFRNRLKIREAVALGQDAGVASFLLKDNVILGEEGLPQVQHGYYARDISHPRYVHIDLSNTGDRCGIAMVRFDGLTEVERVTGEIEILPIATVEMAVSIEPDHSTELDIGEIRTWVKILSRVYGFPIRAVTYDGWNSLESRQQWKKQGMKTGQISVDRTSLPYKHLRDALYDKRLRMYQQEVLLQEMFDLEYDEKRDKIDHPPHSSKDVVDAVCGAYYTLLLRTDTWKDLGEPDRQEYEDRFEDEDRA